jgi:hypothetical protein
MAEAVCVETFVTQSRDEDGGTSTTRHMILAFRTRDGADIRLDRTWGAHVVGDVVHVRYLPEHPELAVVAAPGPAGESIGLGVGVAFGLIFACVGLFFVSVGFGF